MNINEKGGSNLCKGLYLYFKENLRGCRSQPTIFGDNEVKYNISLSIQC